MRESSSTHLQRWIDLLAAGDAGARDELIRHASNRLSKLSRKMLQDDGRIRRWVEADDVMQNAMIRLLRALEAAPPASVVDFFRLATRQIRRELIDLARHYYGPQGEGANHASIAGTDSGSTPHDGADPGTTTLDPHKLLCWTEFHRHVEELPEDERDVFTLLWYQDFTQEEAATLLHVSVPTIKRRWLAARLHLQERLKDPRAGLGNP
jgi:RNA polymerase sigma-70 factor (ECF subfamily)